MESRPAARRSSLVSGPVSHRAGVALAGARGLVGGHQRQRRALSPRLVEDLEDDLGRLRPRDAVLRVDHEEGHPADPICARLRLVGADLLGEAIRAEHSVDLLGGQTYLDGQLRQRGVVRHRAALAEGGPIETLLELVLQPVVEREVQQPMGVKGIAGARQVEAEIEPFAGCGRDHVVDHPLSIGQRGAVLRRQALGVSSPHPVARRSRLVQLEASPYHLHLVAMLEARQSRLEAALADVAPWADDIGPDLDLQAHEEFNLTGAEILPGCTWWVARGTSPFAPPLRARPAQRRRGVPRLPPGRARPRRAHGGHLALRPSGAPLGVAPGRRRHGPPPRSLRRRPLLGAPQPPERRHQDRRPPTAGLPRSGPEHGQRCSRSAGVTSCGAPALRARSSSAGRSSSPASSRPPSRPLRRAECSGAATCSTPPSTAASCSTSGRSPPTYRTAWRCAKRPATASSRPTSRGTCTSSSPGFSTSPAGPTRSCPTTTISTRPSTRITSGRTGPTTRISAWRSTPTWRASSVFAQRRDSR